MSITCENSHLSPEELLKSLITKDVDGNLAIRVISVEGCEEDGVTCDTNHLSLADLLIQCIGTSECGKPAIRLATAPVAVGPIGG